MVYYALWVLKIGNAGMPAFLHWIIPGFALGWAYLLSPAAQSGYSFTYPGGGLWIGGAFVEGFAEAGNYLGYIIPLAITATCGDLMCLVGAYNSGDPYPMGEVLIVDGILTMVGALFGSPFGTVVYFG